MEVPVYARVHTLNPKERKHTRENKPIYDRNRLAMRKVTRNRLGCQILLFVILAFGVYIGILNYHPKYAIAIEGRISSPYDPTKLDLVLPQIKKMATLLSTRVNASPECDLQPFGTGWGKHNLCNGAQPREHPCYFFSFGISHDYSFDLDVADRYHCYGIAADPTVTHTSELHPNVSFHKIAAKMLLGEHEQYSLSSSIPGIFTWTKFPRLSVLKMDCEGCEYSLARDVLLEDPKFFSNVDQLAIELHVSKQWISTHEHLYSLGLLFNLLDDAGLSLQDAQIGGCALHHETMGCMDELVAVGYPCGIGNSCQNLLFARVS